MMWKEDTLAHKTIHKFVITYPNKKIYNIANILNATELFTLNGYFYDMRISP